MAINDPVVGFVQEGLARGLSRDELQAALLRAGWTSEQVRAALASFADIDFPIPVPRPRPYLSARDAFMYLALFGTLYLTAYNVGSIVFELIDRALPDPLSPRSAVSTGQAVRWSVAWVIVASPVFGLLAWSISRGVRLDPARRTARIRKQLTYLTLFIGGTILIGDVTTLVYGVLGGELTARFLLKAATVALIVGVIFAYALRDVRTGETGDRRS